MSTKIIVTNSSRFAAKYGASAATIDTAVAKLVTADGFRGLTTKVVDLSDATEMGAYGLPAVSPWDDEAQAKAAVDAVCASDSPDYVMILGGPDVVPLLTLANPAYSPGGDDDKDVPSDLPYASSAGYSNDTNDFMNPDRVVGRLPDLTAATDPEFLLGLLDRLASFSPVPVPDLADRFAITAQVWLGSSQIALDHAFGTHTGLQVCPTQTGLGPNPLLAEPYHFINCHGAPADHQFYGQSGQNYPVSLDSAAVKAGSGALVATAECCYGAELYDPALAGGKIPISCQYLANGALGFVGSTTIAYGSDVANTEADLVCREVLKEVAGGASLGLAFARSRQSFVASLAHPTPIDVKTMAQFLLLGDPSVHVLAPLALPHAMTSRLMSELDPLERPARRTALRAEASEIAKSYCAVWERRTGPKAEVLATASQLSGVDASRLECLSFDLSAPGAATAPGAKARPRSAPPATSGETVFVFPEPVEKTKNVRDIRQHIVVARDGDVLDARTAYSR